MRFNCETRHGLALVTSSLTPVGNGAIVEWGESSDRKKIGYMFKTPKPSSTSTDIAEVIFATLAASHFERTEAPNNNTVLAFSIEEIAPDPKLRLMPLA